MFVGAAIAICTVGSIKEALDVSNLEEPQPRESPTTFKRKGCVNGGYKPKRDSPIYYAGKG